MPTPKYPSDEGFTPPPRKNRPVRVFVTGAGIGSRDVVAPPERAAPSPAAWQPRTMGRRRGSSGAVQADEARRRAHAAARTLALARFANRPEVALARLPASFSSAKAETELGYEHGPLEAAIERAV